jgi:hypothetical protein
MNTPTPPSGNLASQPAPYSIQASCELSEDYFLTDDVIIVDGDRIMPFSVVDPFTGAVTVEALVLSSSGQLSHLYPDAAATSGWSYTGLKTPFDFVSDAAVVGGVFGGQLMVTGPRSLPAPPGATAAAAWLTRVGPGDWSVSQTGTVPERIGPLSAGLSQEGPYWYGWVPSVVGTTDQFSLLLFDARNAGTEMLTLGWSTQMGIAIENTVVLYDPDQVPDGTATGFAVVLTSDGQISTYNQTGPASFSGQPASTLPTAAAALLWAYTTPGSTTGQPAILWQNHNGIVGFQEETGAWNFTGFTYGSPAGDGQVAAWKLNGAYTFTFLNDGLAQVVSEIPGTGANISWTAPIPLADGIEQIYSLPTDPAASTLFAVAVDVKNLSVLTKDPALGWTQTQVHQDGASLQPVTSWRAQISILDANRAGVAAGQIQLSTDRPVGFWQASGSTILTPAEPVTLTADSGGKITVSIPTEELDTAVLTAQALDSTGKPSGAPLAITPNIDVQNFLAGQGSLTDKGTLTGVGSQPGQALLNAQNTSWDTKTQAYVSSGPLLPKLTSGGAGAVAQALNHVASLGLGYQPSSSTDVQSVSFDLTPGVTPTFQSSTDPNAFSSLSGTLGATSWWDTAKNDAESAFHGLRHGVIEFKHMVSSWDKDAGQWVVNLTVDIGDGLDNLLTYVISDVKTAIHAISSFFHALGADLKNVWEWLKHFVLGVIRDADINAKVLQGWFDSLSTAGIQILDNLEQRTDTFFHDQESNVTTQIQAWKGDVETMLFGSVAPTPAPATGTGGDDSSSAFKAAEDFFKFMEHSPASWLWNKIMSHIQPMSPDSLHVGPSLSQDMPTDVNNILKAAVTTTTALGTMLSDGLKTFTTADGFKQANVGQLFDDFANVTDDVLVLLDKVADTILDLIKDFLTALDDLFTSEFELPVIGEILSLAGINDFTPSIGRVMSLIVAYPATLLHNLWAGEGPMFDFDDDSQTRSAPGLLGRGAADKNGFGLDLAAGVVQYIWASVDSIIDVLALPGKSESAAQAAGDALNVIDFVLPAFMTILQWPTPWNATKTPLPCSNWDFSDATLWGEHNNFIPGIIITTIVPWWAQGATFIWSKTTPDPELIEVDFFNDYATPFIQTAASGANIVLGAWWQYANSHASKTDQANAILDWVIPNLSYFDSPLGIEEFADATEGATSMAKLVIDAVANYGATAFCFQQAVAAKNG